MIKGLRKLLLMEDHVCPWWLAYTFDHRLRRLIHNPEKILAGLLGPGQTAMDIGCGMGFFSLAMANVVGEKGSVIAVDLQPQMLAILRQRAEKAGVAARIRLHQCLDSTHLGVSEPVDFALAFWMVHEVPNVENLCHECRQVLKPQAHLLLVEPKIHVPAARFDRIVELACIAGLKPYTELKVALSRAMLFRPA